MSRPFPIRFTSLPRGQSLVCWLTVPALLAITSGVTLAEQHGEPSHTPAPIVRQPPMGSPRNLNNPNRLNNQNRPHLPEWMQSHSSLPLAQQQRALEQEPGFRQLQPDEQQRMHNRLTQLNNMSPEQRQRVIARNEQMERLSPAQRQQVRSATQQLGSLTPDRRIAVARAFHTLRTLPEPERQNYLNSPQVHGLFSDQERGTLSNLLTVSPYLPQQPRQQGQYPNNPNRNMQPQYAPPQ